MWRRHFVISPQFMQMQNTTDWSHQITGDPVGFSQHYNHAAVTFGWIMYVSLA